LTLGFQQRRALSSAAIEQVEGSPATERSGERESVDAAEFARTQSPPSTPPRRAAPPIPNPDHWHGPIGSGSWPGPRAALAPVRTPPFLPHAEPEAHPPTLTALSVASQAHAPPHARPAGSYFVDEECAGAGTEPSVRHSLFPSPGRVCTGGGWVGAWGAHLGSGSASVSGGRMTPRTHPASWSHLPPRPQCARTAHSHINSPSPAAACPAPPPARTAHPNRLRPWSFGPFTPSVETREDAGRAGGGEWVAKRISLCSINYDISPDVGDVEVQRQDTLPQHAIAYHPPSPLRISQARAGFQHRSRVLIYQAFIKQEGGRCQTFSRGTS
jgi:hypothetical protein